MVEAPKIDKRSAPEVAEQVYGLLPHYVAHWPGRGKEGELANALIFIFARFNELIIERLNRTPTKNLLAFLDLLGISPLPLEPARVPLTFYLAGGNVSHATITAGTQVAAPPPPGQQTPVIFETEKDLVAVSTLLTWLVIKDGGHDRYIDFSSLLVPAASGAASATTTTAVTGDVVPVPHMFYVPLPTLPVWPAESKTYVKFTVDANLQGSIDPRELRWELCAPPKEKPAAAAAPGAAKPLFPAEAFSVVAQQPTDGTANLTQSGDVLFENLPDTEPVAVHGVPARWLRCRLLTPINNSPTASTGTVRASQLPAIKVLTIENGVERKGLSIDQAFFNTVKVDTSKDFFPFGERPKFGDTLYLASQEAFSNPGAILTIDIAVTNPASSKVDMPIPAAKPQDTQLRWEFWDGKEWRKLGTSGVIGIGGDFQDDTQLFSENGTVTLKFPQVPAPALLNLGGQNNYWIRVRIVGGDYGKEAHYEHKLSLIQNLKDTVAKHGLIDHLNHILAKPEVVEELKGGLVLVPSTFAPPSIHSISINYSFTRSFQPDTVLTCNDFNWVRSNPQSGAVTPFVPVPADQGLPTLYFGFTLPITAPAVTFLPQYPMSIYAGVCATVAGQNASADTAATAAWQYWSRAGWQKSIVLDETQGFRRAGLIRFLPAADFTFSDQFGQTGFWLRMRQQDPQFQPKLSDVVLNTTMGVQGATVSNEILGTSNETPGQRFQTTQTPVLAGERLEIRESTEPSLAERTQIQAAEGDNAIVAVVEPTTEANTFWVRWHEVPNFYGSGPRDRHYMLERSTGEVSFGDGINGMIPPTLPANVRATYRTGGGTAGNLPAKAIAQLKTAIPYVQKAANLEAAAGGTDAEPEAAILARGPRTVRHGGRAVTREDFEDLAMLASREVARAKCVPLFDLTQDPDTRNKKPGVVSLILLPRSTRPRPRPSQDLVDRVRAFLDARRELTAKLFLLGPEFIRVDVDCEIAVTEPERASEVEEAVRAALDDYLHPVTGGQKGEGWDFGRAPQRSDFFALLEGIPGVSHVRELRTTLVPERRGSEKTGRFLVSRGMYQVITTLEE